MMRWLRLTLTNGISVTYLGDMCGRLSRIDLAQEADIITILITHDIIAVRLFSLGENVGVRRAVLLRAIAHPVSLARESGAFAPVSLDGPGSVLVVRNCSTFKESGELIGHGHCLHNGCLLVEDSIDLNEVGSRVGDVPAVVAGLGGSGLLIADNRADRTGLVTFDADELDLSASDGDRGFQELGDVCFAVNADRVLLGTCLLVDVNDLLVVAVVVHHVDALQNKMILNLALGPVHFYYNIFVSYFQVMSTIFLYFLYFLYIFLHKYY